MRLSSLAGMLLTAAVGLAAPVPAEEKPKPRAKLLGTLKVKRAVEHVTWTPGGTHLILVAAGKGLVVPRDQLGEDAAPKPTAEFALPTGSGMHFGLTPDGTEVYALLTAGSRFNAESRLCFWSVKDLTDGKSKAKPDRAVSLEVDNPATFALAGDGKGLFVVTSEIRGGSAPPGQVGQYVGKVFRLSVRTGDVADEVLTLDEKDASLVGATVHPASGRVVAHFHTGDENVVRCLDVTTKKVKWERKFEQPPPNTGGNGTAPRVSPDGKAVIAFVSRQLNIPQPGAVPQPGQPPPLQSVITTIPHLLDAANGEPIGELGDNDVTWCGLHDFSADGRLAFGWLNRNSGAHQVAWDTKTGKPLKTWSRTANVTTAAFAPARHELAVVERNEVYQPLPANQYNPLLSSDLIDFRVDSSWVIRQPPVVQQPAEVYSIVGVWDLGPLVK
jgi:hypothetical protein